MEYCCALQIKNHNYLCTLHSSGSVKIASVGLVSLDASGTIKEQIVFSPSIPCSFEHAFIRWNRTDGYVEIHSPTGKQRIEIPVNQPIMLDKACQIIAFVSECSAEKKIADILPNTTVQIGRHALENILDFPAIPFISRKHFSIVRKSEGFYLLDQGSKNGTFLNGVRARGTLPLHEGDIISILTVQFTIRDNALYVKNAEKPNARPNIAPEPKPPAPKTFKRTARIKYGLPKDTITIDPVPSIGQKPDINLIQTFLPMVISIGVGIVIGSAMIYLSVAMAVSGSIVSIVNYKKQKDKFTKNTQKLTEVYETHLQEAEAKLKDASCKQVEALTHMDPAPESCFDIVKGAKPAMWSRTPKDEDFLSVRIGNGTINASYSIAIPHIGVTTDNNPLLDRPAALQKKYAQLEAMPIVSQIGKEQICGLVGNANATLSLANTMILQLATHHSPDEVKLVCIYDATMESRLSWVKNLPHCWDDDHKSFFGVSTKEESEKLFKQFAELLRSRTTLIENETYGKQPLPLPVYVFIILQPRFLSRHDTIHDYLFKESGLGAACMIAVESESQLPQQCREIIVLGERDCERHLASSADKKQAFTPDAVADGLYTAFGVCMSGIKFDFSSVDKLPKKYTFYELMGIKSAQDLPLRKLWSEHNISISMHAPIGIKEGGETIYLDLHEEKHGPHGLIAGTPGSGKSEVIMSYLYAMAIHYPPDEVNFLIIDFKGDGLASQVNKLPHTVGCISNLDGPELARSLRSLNAEKERRLKLFKDYNDTHADTVVNINEYIERYRAKRTDKPLSHLIIVVDEFAELKQKHPEFMSELISVARLGRSGGVHLILSTQNPSGQIDGQIESCVFWRLCLKVADVKDSREIIKSPLAAYVTEKGRGYLKIGEAGQFDLFQSGYSGGDSEISLDGATLTQRAAIQRHISTYCQENGIQQMPPICMPAMEAVVEYRPTDIELLKEGRIAIGIYDDLYAQSQPPYAPDLFNRNTLIIGSPQSGKTSILRTVIRTVAEELSPEQMHIYILDYASGALKVFEPLNHVGGVVRPGEDEKYKNLVRLLLQEMETRKERFTELGVTSYNAYLEAGKTDLARILLLIENVTAMKERQGIEFGAGPLKTVYENGLTYGISVMMTNGQLTGLSLYQDLFATKISLNGVKPGEVFSQHITLQAEELPGRGIVVIDREAYVMQGYLAFAGKKEVERTASIRAMIDKVKAHWGNLRAKPIPCIPDNLTIKDAFSAYPSAYEKGKFMFGLDYDTVAPVSINPAFLGVWAISGQKDRIENFHRYMLVAAETVPSLRMKFYIVDSIDQPLERFSKLSCVAAYSSEPNSARDMLQQICSETSMRYQKAKIGNTALLRNSPTLVLMLNSSAAIQAIAADKAALGGWQLLTGDLRAMNHCTIYGALDNANIPFGASELLRKMKDDRKLVFFDDLDALKIGDDLSYKVREKFAGTFKKGDGYLILGNNFARIRVPSCPVPRPE